MAKVHFINRNFNRSYGIGQGNGGMRQSPRVQKDKACTRIACLKGVNQNSLVIALHIVNSVLGKFLAQGFENCIHTGMAVNFGFPKSQQIKVGAVKDQRVDRIHETKGRP